MYLTNLFAICLSACTWGVVVIIQILPRAEAQHRAGLVCCSRWPHHQGQGYICRCLGRIWRSSGEEGIKEEARTNLPAALWKGRVGLGWGGTGGEGRGRGGVGQVGRGRAEPDKNLNLSLAFAQLALLFFSPNTILNKPKIQLTGEHAMRTFSHACLLGAEICLPDGRIY